MKGRLFTTFTVGVGAVMLALLVASRAKLTATAVSIGDRDGISRSTAVQDVVASAAYSVTGRVTDESGTPYGGVQIRATGGYSATTQANGRYTFTQLLTGAYQLTPWLTGFFFDPITRSVMLPPDATGQDFIVLSGTVAYVPLILNRFPNLPPLTPSNPAPVDGASGQSVDVDLSWSNGDPDGDSVTYDVYLEADDDTPDVQVSDDQSITVFDPGTLDANTHYFWRVTATDEHGATTAGPVWNFRTASPPADGWLAYVNLYRSMVGLSTATENSDWNHGCWLHARYMVKNDAFSHGEDPANPWYDPAGHIAAQNSNVMVSSNVNRTDQDAIDFWMRAPFHAVSIIDPELEQVGYGSYREAIGTYHMAAALDVRRGRGSLPGTTTFPIRWPAAGSTVSLTSNGLEWPDPLTSCPGYSFPAGLPIILQIGAGAITPDVTDHSFRKGATSLDHCVFDETSYVSPDSGEQSTGRLILGSRDAIVLVPKEPLEPGTTYDVSITANGHVYNWSFSVSSSARSARLAQAVEWDYAR